MFLFEGCLDGWLATLLLNNMSVYVCVCVRHMKT
jgi:hypothetical protein